MNNDQYAKSSEKDNSSVSLTVSKWEKRSTLTNMLPRLVKTL